jgi:nitrite reductase/ring-hydroxylating ferredoxin subunit/uncharacterized membrane protein
MNTSKRGTMASRLDAIAERIERWKALDGIADRLADGTAAVLGGSAVRDLLSGTPIGHPLHPLAVAMPIGSWSSAVIFDLVGDREGAERLTLIGVLTALPSALSGLSDWRFTSEAERRVGLVHAVFNTTAVTAYGLSWWARRRQRYVAGVIWSMAGAAALTGGGWLGGHLAYALGVGVDTTAFQHGEADWTDVAAETEIRSGELVGVEVDGVPVVLTRSPEGDIVALGDRCSHRGGPLHEGTIQDGCIECPWHSSRFSLDGTVVSGPATRPQPRYAVRVDGGRVMVGRTGEVRALRLNPAGH